MSEQAAAFGRVAKVVDVPTQGVTRLVVELPIEAFRRAVAVFHAMEVLVTLAPPDIGKEHPYGMLGEAQTASPAAETAASGADLDSPRGVVAKTAVASASGPKCVLTVQWCADPAFRQWFSGAFPAQVDAVADQVPAKRKDWAEQVTGLALKLLLGIDSRKQIDSDPAIGKAWNEIIRVPWMAAQHNAKDPF